jgi:hypothetical protein
MSNERILFTAGVTLLSAAALVGFKQYHERERPESFARWRVVHAGGTSGAVQLLALAAAFGHFRVHGALASSVGAGVLVATVLFFFGPLAQALRFSRTGSWLNVVGALFAVPAYLGLPFVAFGGP